MHQIIDIQHKTSVFCAKRGAGQELISPSSESPDVAGTTPSLPWFLAERINIKSDEKRYEIQGAKHLAHNVTLRLILLKVKYTNTDSTFRCV